MSTVSNPSLGVRSITAEEYHSDPCGDTPSLSSSIAHLICSQSPAHARQAHPKLSPDFAREEREHFDVGTAAHAMLLEGEAALAVLDFPDWRTNAAKEAREAARAEGKIPLLAHTAAEVYAMVDAARAQLAAHGATPSPFTDGKPEQTLVWEEPGGVVCRARLDWLRDDNSAIDDLKTTSRSADPATFSRRLFGFGGDVQAAFYLRGLEQLTGERAEFRWVVIETYAPYALSVVAPGPDVLTIAEKKVSYALDVWRRCLDTGSWPAYPTEVCWASLPAHEEFRWLEKEEREA